MYKPYKMWDGLWVVYNTEIPYPKPLGEFFSWSQAQDYANKLNRRNGWL